MKIFIIGFMGSGKSTCGKELAAKLGLKFLDLDEQIAAETGRSVGELFDKDGEEEFRRLENNALKALLDKDEMVIAAGGGTPCYFNNMELMNRNGITVYLKMSVDSLVERLSASTADRPLIRNMKGEELKNFITLNLENRENFYLQAQFKVKGKNLNMDELAGFIKNEMGVTNGK